MSSTAEPAGTVDVAVSHAARLLAGQPALAAEQAAEILKYAPDHPAAQLLLGVAHRRTGHSCAALETLEALARQHPGWALAHYELALAMSSVGRPQDACAALRRALALKPEMSDAWRALGDELLSLGDATGADAAYARQIKTSVRDPRLLAAASALCENDIPRSEALLREHLKSHPTDVAAMRMLAEVAARLRRYHDAETLLARCLELAPGFEAARYNYAIVLHRQGKPVEALREVETLLRSEPAHPGYRNLKAAILVRIGEYARSIELYESVLATAPRQPKVWMSYGHALKTCGREADSIRAYRTSIELQPGLGEAYWSLANLKTFRFAPQDVDGMRTELRSSTLSDEDRFHLHFALGKALEDAGEYADSFGHYDRGNGLRRATTGYRPQEITAHVQRCKALFDSDFFASRADFGHLAPDPIFIVGLPRSGSTLIEQILSSHSQVEGTMELPDLPALVKDLGMHRLPGGLERGDGHRYLQLLERLDAGAFAELGCRYLERTRIQRKTSAPFFIDKLPNNFAHVGLIHLALPRARIIDARRHPLGCCFSCCKQPSAHGQHFSYSQQDLGIYYRDYVELMAHFDTVLPGRVHRVFYERMVEDTAGEVARLLAYCGLPFETDCLRFHENERAVRTASSQQVRQPIYRQGLDHWQRFEPWLDPLKEALGPVLADYPRQAGLI